jgi:hypothetical protein
MKIPVAFKSNETCSYIQQLELTPVFLHGGQILHFYESEILKDL